MSEIADAPTSFAAIIVAAGKGLRVGGEIPKQFLNWRGKPLIRHSAEALLDQGADEVFVAIPEGATTVAAEALGGLLDSVTFVTGGATRQQSVRNALEAAASSGHSRVLIHDAARPHIPLDVTQRLIGALRDGAVGSIPVLDVVDSMVFASDGKMGSKADREALKRVQTPQAFWFDDILAAHRAWNGEPNAGDDAQVLKSFGGDVALVPGDERLKKITFSDDLKSEGAAMRIGQGYDVHALSKGEELWLCGIQIEHDMGLAGHSDADVALHAVVDAILGALGDGDIGTHFPPSDPQWKGAASPMFVQHACALMERAGYTLGNLDLTIICEAPKIGPHRDAMRMKLADIMGVDLDQISVKATTTEKLGFTGRGEGIAAQAVVLINKKDRN